MSKHQMRHVKSREGRWCKGEILQRVMARANTKTNYLSESLDKDPPIRTLISFILAIVASLSQFILCKGLFLYVSIVN